MMNMFANCYKLTTTITIRNDTVTYESIFSNAAIGSGSRITVNYTTVTSILVDQMLTTNSTNSNVVKGMLVS